MISQKDQRDQSAGSYTRSISRELIVQSEASQEQENSTQRHHSTSQNKGHNWLHNDSYVVLYLLQSIVCTGYSIYTHNVWLLAALWGGTAAKVGLPVVKEILASFKEQYIPSTSSKPRKPKVQGFPILINRTAS